MYKLAFFSFLALFCYALPAEGSIYDVERMTSLIKGIEDNKEIDINTRDTKGRTLLMWAVLMEHPQQAEIVRILLKAGADIHAKDEIGMSALMLAAMTGRTELMQLLIDEGADPHVADNEGYTLLMVVVVGEVVVEGGKESQKESREETVKILLKAGVDLNAQSMIGRTALIEAAIRGYTKTVQLLLEAGADFTIKDGFDFTALQYAAIMRHQEVMQALINAGAEALTPEFIRWLNSK